MGKDKTTPNLFEGPPLVQLTPQQMQDLKVFGQSPPPVTVAQLRQPGPFARNFDKRAAKEAGEKGIDRAASNADEGWKDRARAALRRVATRQRYITADDVWKELQEDARNNSAMGAIFSSAARKHWIEKTGRVVESQRVSRHGSSLRVWGSLIVGQSPES